MSYEKHSWVYGKTITPALLNHMEDGIASASEVFWVHATYDSSTEQVSVTESGSEIIQAYADGKIILCEVDVGEKYVLYPTGDFSTAHFNFDRIECVFSGTPTGSVYPAISIRDTKLTGEGYQEEDESWSVTWTLTYSQFDDVSQG